MPKINIGKVYISLIIDIVALLWYYHQTHGSRWSVTVIILPRLSSRVSRSKTYLVFSVFNTNTHYYYFFIAELRIHILNQDISTILWWTIVTTWTMKYLFLARINSKLDFVSGFLAVNFQMRNLRTGSGSTCVKDKIMIKHKAKANI